MTQRLRRGLTWLALPASVLALGLARSPQEPAKEAPKPQYLGAEACKLCHTRKTVGGQFKIWKEEKHAKAFEVLATPQAKEVGAKQGVADPQKDPKCLKCHVTGFGLPEERYAKTYKASEGITCEACHGAAGLYVDEEKHTKENAKSDKFGLVHPDEKTCRTCHNPESPSYKEFDYQKFFDQIKHPVPKK
jgi:hypothetical protein